MKWASADWADLYSPPPLPLRRLAQGVQTTKSAGRPPAGPLLVSLWYPLPRDVSGPCASRQPTGAAPLWYHLPTGAAIPSDQDLLPDPNRPRPPIRHPWVGIRLSEGLWSCAVAREVNVRIVDDCGHLRDRCPTPSPGKRLGTKRLTGLKKPLRMNAQRGAQV